jgi:hypothetical protein
MRKVNIGMVVRTYDETGCYFETRDDKISCKSIPEDVMKELMCGEVICVQLAPNVEAFYFEVPKDWPKNWTTLEGSSDKQYQRED